MSKDQSPELRPGARIDQYEVLATLGAGGMGRVYLVRDTTLPETAPPHALKELFHLEESQLARFAHEALTLKALKHPNILAYHRFTDRSGAAPYLITEYLAGGDLGDLLVASRRLPAGPQNQGMTRVGRLSPAMALSITRQLASALALVHGRGIAHRDLKPANILLTAAPEHILKAGQATVKLADFGIATRELRFRPKLTSDGSFIGTLDYCPPEYFDHWIAWNKAALDGQDIGWQRDLEEVQQGDVFALGLLLYELLTGQAFYAVPPSASHQGNPVALLLASGPARKAALEEFRSKAKPTPVPDDPIRSLVSDDAIRSPISDEPIRSLLLQMLEVQPKQRISAALVEERLKTLLAPPGDARRGTWGPDLLEDLALGDGGLKEASRASDSRGEAAEEGATAPGVSEKVPDAGADGEDHAARRGSGEVENIRSEPGSMAKSPSPAIQSPERSGVHKRLPAERTAGVSPVIESPERSGLILKTAGGMLIAVMLVGGFWLGSPSREPTGEVARIADDLEPNSAPRLAGSSRDGGSGGAQPGPAPEQGLDTPAAAASAEPGARAGPAETPPAGTFPAETLPAGTFPAGTFPAETPPVASPPAASTGLGAGKNPGQEVEDREPNPPHRVASQPDSGSEDGSVSGPNATTVPGSGDTPIEKETSRVSEQPQPDPTDAAFRRIQGRLLTPVPLSSARWVLKEDGGGRFLELPLQADSPVRAPWAGSVYYVNPGEHFRGGGDAGACVAIAHAKNYSSYICGLSADGLVAQGQSVKRGDAIAQAVSGQTVTVWLRHRIPASEEGAERMVLLDPTQWFSQQE